MEKVIPINTSQNAVKSAADRPPKNQLSHQLISDKNQLRLHQKLQGSLDLGSLINHFFVWLSEQQPLGSVEYVYPDEDISLLSGSLRAHQAHYTLRLQKRYLGELTISSQKRFSEQDLFVHEQSIGCLAHYLKNALDFRAMEKMAFYDALTGVMNRKSLDELLPKETKRAERHGYDLSVMMIDIDNFKIINDRVGHIGGDQILKHASKAIRQVLRISDLPFRFGGDEFVLLLPNTDLVGARSAAKQIVASLGNSAVEINNHSITPRVSIGLASYRHGEHHEELIRRADQALYDAKKNGRNCIC